MRVSRTVLREARGETPLVYSPCATHKRLSPFGAVLLMGEGLPKSACRGRFQTAKCCCI